MVTKQEALDFIAYLKGLGEKITVESRVEVHRTMFNRYVIDPYYADAKMIRDLCIVPSTPLEIYNVYAAQMAKLNSLWKIIPGFGSVYVEDVIEYLMSQGIGYDDAWSIYNLKDKSVEKSVK